MRVRDQADRARRHPRVCAQGARRRAPLRDRPGRGQGDVRELQAEPGVRQGDRGDRRDRAACPKWNTRARGASGAERPSRRRARTGDPRAGRAAADLAAAADRAAVEPRRRPSRADRAHAKQEEDRARREAAAEAAG